MINLTYTSSLLNHQFIQFIKNHDITIQQYNILRVLRGYRSEGPASIGFLKERMLDRYSDVSRIVDKLFTKGLVNRTEKSNDRRQKDVEISEKGILLLSQMDQCEQKVDTLLTSLSLEEVMELNRLLDKIRERKM
jgi:MarR family transcriptional regulator, multiple gene regulator MgrA